MKAFDKLLIGWGKIEAPIIACAALKKHVFLLGKHGIGKTTLGKVLGSAIGGTDSFGFYPADKANEFDICGFPDIENSKKENANIYIKSSNTIWNKKVIVVDELSRAPRDNQNLWLEILEEGTARGNPIPLEMAIATANPITYAGTMTIDAALQDRFWVVVPAPDLTSDEIEEETITGLIDTNLTRADEQQSIVKELRDLIEQTRSSYNELLRDKDVAKKVKHFISKLLHVVLRQALQNKTKLYISPRNCIQLYHVAMACMAYFKILNDDFWLEEGAKAAIQYNLIMKNGAALTQVVEPILYDLLPLLRNQDDKLVSLKILLKFASGSKVIEIIEQHKAIFEELSDADKTQIIETCLQNIENDNDLVSLSKLHHISPKGAQYRIAALMAIILQNNRKIASVIKLGRPLTDYAHA